MLQLFFLAIACAAAVGRQTTGDPLQHPVLHTVGMLGAVAGVALVMRLSASVKCLQRLEPSHLGLAALIVATGLLLHPIQWPTLVRANLGLRGWVLLDEMLIVIPFLLTWITATCDPRSLTNADTAWRFIVTHLRSTLAVAVLPILVVTTVADVSRLAAPTFFVTHGAAVMASSLIVMMLFYPVALRFIWKCRPLPSGPLRERLLTLITQQRTSVRDILVWDTDGQIANAAVVGLFRPCRYVLLTDGLLAQLEEDEVFATFAHELGHVQHRHLMWRMLATLMPVAWCIAARVWVDPLSHVVVAAGFSLHTAILAACVAYGLVVLGWYSRRLEFQADLFACRTLIQQHGDARRALSQYVRVLAQLIERRHHRRSGWLHPSFAQRRRFLIDHLRSEPLARAFHHEMVAIAAALVGLLAAALAPLLVV